eukprot:CAMPEP_0197045230 /NCGR_PEP_ID=MMETSP1384-20130603/21129_1 /TAXON_ID=29189 /ORGANISM="Ammonia sp." /LENGTH=580 /DNA_ID=CAMNT_0042476811 /DNA_START=1 /DNA_END=1743 /DNA_ORIENTATION=-
MSNLGSWFGGGGKKNQASKTNAPTDLTQQLTTNAANTADTNKKKNEVKAEDVEEDVDIKWFDDIVEGSDSSQSNKQILSKLWEQVTGENMISRIRSPSQRKAGKIWGRLCHRVDIGYPQPNCLQIMDCFDTQNALFMNELRYAVRHAVASYPPSFIVFLGMKNDPAFAFKSTKSLLMSVFHVQPQDVIMDRCSNSIIIPNSTHQPSFYLCVDHAKQKIVISIRGSSSIADALTDVNAVAKPYSCHDIDGHVHEGILASTKFVFDNVTKPLVKICNQYTKYQVIVTGHSLGAGVAALLGLMYNEHPVICKQNRLRVFAFASPCVISQEFTDKQIAENYIYSIALSTDLVTRLSLESVKQSNLRLDAITNASQDTIKKCMMKLVDEEEEDTNDNDNDQETEQKETDEAKALLRSLRSMPTPNPKERLFPLGKVLWFVPKAAMDDDDAKRRGTLMCLKDYKQKSQKTGDDDENDEEAKSQQTEKKQYVAHGKNASFSNILSTTWNNMAKGFEEFQEVMDSSILNSGTTKYAKRYDGSNYILCEATNCRSIFQELVLDLPESLYSHMPNRYLWCCDAHLTREKL